KPGFVMLPLYDVLDYLQAITPYFVKRFCHYTTTNFYADLRIVISKISLRNWILKSCAGRRISKLFVKQKIFYSPLFFAFNTVGTSSEKFIFFLQNSYPA
ncbi:MAG TPA: hypothetical protein VGM30_16585, partial [Puia sp.]